MSIGIAMRKQTINGSPSDFRTKVMGAGLLALFCPRLATSKAGFAGDLSTLFRGQVFAAFFPAASTQCYGCFVFLFHMY